jgi:chromate transporter
LLLGLAAAVALFRFKRSVMEVIFASALIGLAIKTLSL